MRQSVRLSLLRAIQGAIAGAVVGLIGFVVAVDRVLGFQLSRDDEGGGLVIALFGAVLGATAVGAVVGKILSGHGNAVPVKTPSPATGGVGDRELDGP